MPDTSARLQLPFIQAAQAQKHVTHNEALLKLDGLVQLAVASKDQSTPPGSPIDGESYVVAAGATGAWAGQEGNLAIWQGTAWSFHVPNEGWTAWVADLDRLWSFDGTAWVESAPPEDFQNLAMVGINTLADAGNRLSVAAAATLLSNEGAGHQLKINKAADSDTASLLFQSAWTGHAEMGLIGGTDFTIKTSDGVSWFAALTCAAANGRVSLPAGVSGAIEVFDTGASVFIGEGAGASDDLSANANVFVGFHAGTANSSGYNNIGIGYGALAANSSGYENTAFGYRAMEAVTTGNKNSGFGSYSLLSCTTAANNMGLGFSALRDLTTGSNNAAVGANALRHIATAAKNTGVGLNALRYTTTGANNTGYSNCTGIGYDSRVSGSNQVQLGDSTTTTYAYGAVQDRSDARDKADIRDTVLGLDFITRLRPVDFRWDMRDDYFDEVEEVDPQTGETLTRIVPVPKDGSRKRGRFHHGLIAQEVAQVLADTGLDFGGYQDHSYSGGEDVRSIGYTELIAPLIKAVQELAGRLAVLEARVGP